MEDLNLDLTWFSISCSLDFSSLFWRSICCRALSFFWEVLRSVCSSPLSCSVCTPGDKDMRRGDEDMRRGDKDRQ
ncbi:hypothetical protein EYF80_031818 [Liparis tanakae]|uniref:Uncharacterized protein n=1 Tax=Liparis tanakae TaxID=230148 RepID=A0A4Z2GZH1_9TELE|nr:hypothetical protein EYF80_031818 [Liparis tanakae]